MWIAGLSALFVRIKIRRAPCCSAHATDASKTAVPHPECSRAGFEPSLAISQPASPRSNAAQVARAVPSSSTAKNAMAHFVVYPFELQHVRWLDWAKIASNPPRVEVDEVLSASWSVLLQPHREPASPSPSTFSTSSMASATCESCESASEVTLAISPLFSRP